MFQTYRLRCRTLTPVHIGTGEVLEPFNYHMQNSTLFVFNLSQFISSAEPKLRGEFLKIIDGNDIVGLRQFIRKHIDVEKYSLFRIKVTPEIAREYEVKKDDIRNQLLINPFIRNETTGMCYIPGSSIKGAIRTGVLNYVLRQKDREKIKREIKKEKPKWAARRYKGKPELSNTQVRKFYNEIKAIERYIEMREPNTFVEKLPEIKMIKAKAAYAYGRKLQKKGGSITKEFKEFLDTNIDSIKTQRDFQIFCKLFEAVLGFFEFYSFSQNN